MRFSNLSLAMATALLVVGFGGANATAQTFQAPTNQPPTDQAPTDQAPGAKSDITRVQAGSDTSGVVSGQAKSDEPSGAGSKQLPSPNSEDQGGTGIKGSAQSEGATNKDTTPRDTAPE